MSFSVVRNPSQNGKLPLPPRHEDGTVYPFEMICEGGKYRVYADTPTELCGVLIPDYATLYTPGVPSLPTATTNAAAAQDAGDGDKLVEEKATQARLEAGVGAGAGALNPDGITVAALALRIRYAVTCQVQLQTLILASLSAEEEATLTPAELQVLYAPRDVPPNLKVWESHLVPLVLVSSYYAPLGPLPCPVGKALETPDQKRAKAGAAGAAGSAADTDTASPLWNIIWLEPLDEVEFLYSLHEAGLITLSKHNKS